MAKETFMLVSLKEQKAKKLAQVISSDTCRKILEFLSGRDATESEIAKELQLPISTVHYNMKHLVESKLVKIGEFHYSEKGKEVNHYSLTNQFVIIAPKDADEGLKSKLKKILPPLVVVLAVAGFIELISRFIGRTAMFASDKALGAINAPATMEAMPVRQAEMVADAATKAGTEVVGNVTINLPISVWFIIGAVVALLVFFIIEAIRNRGDKN